MTGQGVSAQKPPKLRSSCDACGAAKVKCDRSQPHCGRCVSLGVECVYGVSKKMGKPKRKEARIPDALPRSPTGAGAGAGAGAAALNQGISGFGGKAGLQEGGGGVDLSGSSPNTSISTSTSTGVRPPSQLSNTWLADMVPTATTAANGYGHGHGHGQDYHHLNSGASQLDGNGVDAIDALWTDLIGTSPPQFTEFAHEAMRTHGADWSLPRLATLGMMNAANAANAANPFPTTPASQGDGGQPFDGNNSVHESWHQQQQAHVSSSVGASPSAADVGKCHNCFQETYDILGGLFLSNVNAAGIAAAAAAAAAAAPTGVGSVAVSGGSMPQSPMGSVSTLSNSSSTHVHSNSRVSLDQILHRSREASQRLSRVLTCNVCPRSPGLALLFVSIISRVLVWYQQAVDCMLMSTQDPPSTDSMVAATSDESAAAAAAAAAAATSGHTQHYYRRPSIATTLSVTNSMASHPHIEPSISQWTRGGSGSGSGSSNDNNDSTATAADSSATTTTPSSTTLDVAPVKMVVGTFDVNDARVQMALNVQLLLGEVRGLAGLIEHFGTYGSSGGPLDSDLYQTLDTWLRSQHARISNTIKMRLTELNN